MEKNTFTELEELTLSSASKEFLRETSKWAYFLSIIGFILIGFMVILAFSIGAIINAVPMYQGMGAAQFKGVLTVVYLIIAAIYFFPVYYLLKFSRSLKEALFSKDDDVLTKAFEMLKSHYKFIGIFTIITVSIYLLIFIFATIGGAMV